MENTEMNNRIMFWKFIISNKENILSLLNCNKRFEDICIFLSELTDSFSYEYITRAISYINRNIIYITSINGINHIIEGIKCSYLDFYRVYFLLYSTINTKYYINFHSNILYIDEINDIINEITYCLSTEKLHICIYCLKKSGLNVFKNILDKFNVKKLHIELCNSNISYIQDLRNIILCSQITTLKINDAYFAYQERVDFACEIIENTQIINKLSLLDFNLYALDDNLHRKYSAQLYLSFTKNTTITRFQILKSECEYSNIKTIHKKLYHEYEINRILDVNLNNKINSRFKKTKAIL